MTRDALDDTLPASVEPHLTPPPGESRPTSRPSIPPSASPTIPAPSERYHLGKELGRGGMGRVVEALDTQLGRTVALKEVLSTATEATERRFRREVQVTARLEHPSIVPLYDSGIGREGRPYYVMRRVTGRPFDEVIARARGLDERLTLLPSMLQAIEAIAHAHKRGVIHRDLKPANILVGELGETVVIDWGLAKVLGEADPDDDPHGPEPEAGMSLQTQIGSIFGTPGFMSPEQARGEVLDQHVDVYALGACLYQLLAGTPPHTGTSATEMIDRTIRHDVKPLAELAPGTPPELVAIVDKALAYDAAERYPDAGALAEDVRRFLDGQLVAAHHYTSRQRLARLARRHRAVLGVAALASVALAAFAWVGVSRIVVERDAATAARGVAEQEREDAKRANTALAERKDELIVANAVNVVASNPTQALAILKQLPRDSKYLAEARATAQAAVARGVAWVMPTSIASLSWLDLSPDSRLVAVRTVRSYVTIFDLDRHKQLAALTLAANARMLWLGSDRLLVLGATPEVIDARSGRVTPFAIPAADDAESSLDGATVIVRDEAGAASIVDVASMTVRPVGVGRKITSLTLAADGSWYVIADAAGLVTVHDTATDAELTRHVLTVQRLARSSGRAFAIFEDQRAVTECVFDDTPAWHQVPMTLSPTEVIVGLEYHGDVLLISTSASWYYSYKRGKRERFTLPSVVSGSPTANGGMTLFSGDSNSMFLLRERGYVRLVLPMSANAPRIAVNRHRAVVVTQGLVAEFELDGIAGLTEPIAANANVAFFGSDTVAVFSSPGAAIDWVDLPSQRVVASTPLAGPLMFAYAAANVSTLATRAFTARGTFELALVTPRATERTILGEGTDASWAVPLNVGGAPAAVYSLGDNAVRFRLLGEPETVLCKLDGQFAEAVQVSDERIAALGAHGELVFANLVTKAIERHHIATPVPSGLVSDRKGALYAASDQEVLAWSGTQWTPLGELPREIASIQASVHGLSIQLVDNSLLEYDVAAKTMTPMLGSSYRLPLYGFDSYTFASLENPSTLRIVDLRTHANWTVALPQPVRNSDTALSISPDARTLLQPSGLVTTLRELPRAPEDLQAWLDDQTNATVDPRTATLRWPWDLPATP